jgi:hypothetical protein
LIWVTPAKEYVRCAWGQPENIPSRGLFFFFFFFLFTPASNSPPIIMTLASEFEQALEHTGGHGKTASGVSIQTFLASLATAMVVFAVEVVCFTLLKGKLTRI